jgi:hypothetical protein
MEMLLGFLADSAGVMGMLPASWSSMGMLEELYLSSNELSGTLPRQWSALGNLDYLDISGNQLTGTIPEVSRITAKETDSSLCCVVLMLTSVRDRCMRE